MIGTAGTAGLIRVMRSGLLDEQYVITARAKGVSEPGLLFKYPVRIAINPIISTIGWILPGIVSGETITTRSAIVLQGDLSDGLPTPPPTSIRSATMPSPWSGSPARQTFCWR